MTTKVTVDAHAGWPVKVTHTNNGLSEVVQPMTKSDFYVHSGTDLLVHEVQPDDELHVVSGDMNFSQALVFLKHGYRLARKGWNGKAMFLFLVSGSTFNVNRRPLLDFYPEGAKVDYHPHIDMKTADDKVVPWVASQTDLLANDWVVL